MKTTIDGADFATITTRRLLVGIGRLYDLAKIFTGDDLFTHELPGMGRFAEEYLATRYPAIAAACKNARDRVILHPEEWSAVAADLRRMYPAIEVDSPLPGWSRDFMGAIAHMENTIVVEGGEDR